MTAGTIRYTVGNENNPGDPWGRSDRVVAPDGSARLDHHFSRFGGSGAWTGTVDSATLAAIWAGLDRAGFPEVPAFDAVAGSTLRKLVVESGGVERRALLVRHQTASMLGYAEAFDLLDGVIRELSGGSVTYPTKQRVIVLNIAPVALSEH
jgi:hypothetical protein